MNNHKPECTLSWANNPIDIEYCSFCNPTLENQITDMIVFTSSGFHCTIAGCQCDHNWKDDDSSRKIFKDTAQKIISSISGKVYVSEPIVVKKEVVPVYIEETFRYIPSESKFIHLNSGMIFTPNELNLPYEDIYELLKKANILPVDDLIDQLREFNENKRIKNEKTVSFLARRTVV